MDLTFSYTGSLACFFFLHTVRGSGNGRRRRRNGGEEKSQEKREEKEDIDFCFSWNEWTGRSQGWEIEKEERKKREKKNRTRRPS